MKTLREYVADALVKKVAVGHFNISNVEGFWAVVRAAKALSEKAGREIPVIIGVSEGERDFIGIAQVRALVDTVKNSQPVFLNADHTYSFERVKEVIDAGFDSAIFDGAQLSYDDNVATTKKCVDYVREISKKTGRDIILEAEMGFIGKSSEVHDSLPEGVGFTEEFLTKVDVAKSFIAATGADMFAPAIGNMHGLLKSGPKPALNIQRIADISKAVGIPLVLHGGSGDSESDLMHAIDSGIGIVHINTELRLAYRNALKLFLQDNPDEIAPYKFSKPALQAMQAVVEKKLAIFNKLT
jgi:fructose-bisphosphate aldolase class II